MLFLQATAAGDPNNMVNSVINWFTQNGLDAVKKIVIGLIILYVGFKIIKFIRKKLSKAFEKQSLDETLRPVITSIVSIALKIMLIIAVIGYVGIPMSSFIALLGAAGLAVGMALSGTIQNVAGGIIILVFRPFKLGDYISTQGIEGFVESIKIFSTTVRTWDNKLITLPNGTLSGGNVTNFSTMDKRRVNVTLQVAGDKKVVIDKIEKDLIDIAYKHEMTLKDPAPVVWVSIGPGTISFDLRAWCKGEDYWILLGYLERAVYDYNIKENLPCPYTVLGKYNWN
ncbi:MAG: mechanosensitive ion channel family protein [Bacteroidales bacterium]|nr:mechanosensitive ion channel family protein [Bacteroidales bacterium]